MKDLVKTGALPPMPRPPMLPGLGGGLPGLAGGLPGLGGNPFRGFPGKKK
jgi:signal recognition particle subunit SRP54